MLPQNTISLALVDDHNLFRKGLISLIEMTDLGPRILFEADNGIKKKKKLNPENLPDIILMDIHMPKMDGFESVKWLKKNYPQVKVLVVSMVEKEETVIKMLKLGIKGYLTKDVEPEELRDALIAISSKGFYYTDFITGRLVHSVAVNDSAYEEIDLNEKEKMMLSFCCTDLTYADIAVHMCLSPKTVDHYRNNLFVKLNVKSRVGLALFAVKHGIVEL